MNLLARFRELVRPDKKSGSNTFNVTKIPGFPSHRLGKDSEGAPVLLLHTLQGSGELIGPVILQHIAVQHNVQCRIDRGEQDAPHDDIFTLVRCSSGEPALREYFIRAVELIVCQVGVAPRHSDVIRSLRRLTELFRAFEQPARRTVQGLWAELMLIESSSNPELLLKAWHDDPFEAYDFALGPSRIEVKSFSSLSRRHSFSLRQINPGPGVNVVVASALAERSSGGVSISDLITHILERGVGVEAAVKLREIVAQSLGESAANGLSITFDFERGRQSLLYFDAASIPSINPVLPPGVLSVRFEAILDENKALSHIELRARGGLFLAASPGK